MKAFIIFRDRVTYARRCFAALREAGLDVYVVDHGSTWPAALEWLYELDQAAADLGGRSAIKGVMWRTENAYPWQLWQWGPFRDLMQNDPQPYVVTDPDVVPSEGCPDYWLGKLVDSLKIAPPEVIKVGLGLRTDLVPDSRRPGVMKDEDLFWKREWKPGLWWANTDTTLAVYRPFGEYPLYAMGPTLRTGWPFVAHHLGWYEEDGKLSEELRWYHAHANAHHQVQRIVY